MTPQQKLSNLLELAQRLGITVRHVPLGGDGGGLCAVKGQRMLFVDLSADTSTQCEHSLAALASIPEIDSVYVVPELRECLNHARGGSTP
jgi:hypothetical protein